MPEMPKGMKPGMKCPFCGSVDTVMVGGPAQLTMHSTKAKFIRSNEVDIKNPEAKKDPKSMKNKPNIVKSSMHCNTCKKYW